MPRPQITVTVTQALAKRGPASPTGTAFIVYATPSATPVGPANPVVCLSSADATTASVPAGIAAWVGDCLAEGAPQVVVVRATAADASNVTQSEWAAGLAKFTVDYGPGQVTIPGVATAAAYSALLAHGSAANRCVLLDATATPTAATLATTAAGLAAAAGSTDAGLITPWVTVPISGGGTRSVPGSLIAAGRAAAGDARAGHANQAPAGLHDGGAGVSVRGIAVSQVFTDADVDTLYGSGVNVIRIVQGAPTLMGWESLAAADPLYHQLNVGRFAMQLQTGLATGAAQFLFRQIDGRGHLYAELEGALRGYLQPLWAADALFGDTAADAFDVDVASVNTPTSAAAGQLNALVQAALTPHTEKVAINVVASLAQGVAS